jgi:outer membrane protein OmpA-like peptidoglycan-associated protein
MPLSGFDRLPLRETMHKGILRVVTVLILVLLNWAAAQASDYKGGYFGGKFGINDSSATGAINAPSASTFAYGVQGGYLEGGYNWDISTATLGMGAYADFNADEIHTNGVEYGSRAVGLDVKLGMAFDDWLFYGKVGYGYSSGTKDLAAVTGRSPNAAIGAEYKFASRWGAVVEYKVDNFSSQDASTSIKNRVFAFGLNYYFDRPEREQAVVAAVPELEPELPDPDAEAESAAEPPPDIGSDIASGPAAAPAVNLDPASWATLLEGKSVRVEGGKFVAGSVLLETGVVSGSVTLDQGSVKILDEVANFAGRYPDAKLELVGYADNVGTDEFNQEQSLGRAVSARNYLVKKGVAANRITTKGMGPKDPIGDNNTYEGRIANRHVEILATVKEQKKDSTASSVPKPQISPVPAATSDHESWKLLLADKPVLVYIAGAGFVSGGDKRSEKISKELDEIVEFSGKYPEKNLELVGYADSTGSAKSNQKLSLQRAESVTKYLVDKGVAASRIITSGAGSANPVGDNATKAGRIKNRRVEIRAVARGQKKSGEVTPVPSPVAVSVPATAPITWKLLLEEKPVLVNIEGTSFDSGSGMPTPKVVEELDEVVGFAGRYPDSKFELTGYTDSTGSAEFNQKLSLARAESVKKYLVGKGVSPGRITTNSGGSAKPVGDNKTKEGRAKNRRVEIHSIAGQPKNPQ